MKGVKLVKIVREFLKLNPWEMHKKMKKKTVQSYLSLERKAERITIEDFLLLEKLYIEGGGTSEQFKKEVEKSVIKKK